MIDLMQPGFSSIDLIQPGFSSESIALIDSINAIDLNVSFVAHFLLLTLGLSLTYLIVLFFYKILKMFF